MIDIEYEPAKQFKPIYSYNWDLLILVGGRGAGKTYDASHFVMINLLNDPKKKAVILRDVFGSIEQSIFAELKEVYNKINNCYEGTLKNHYEVLETEIKYIDPEKGIRDTILYSKGMRKSRVDQDADLKGFVGINYALLEELADVRDEGRVLSLLDSLRKDGVKIIFILNTPDVNHWVIKRFFDLEKVKEIDGQSFFKIHPKNEKGLLAIVTDYTKNIYLDKKTKIRYDNYNNPDSVWYNPAHYYGSILGLATSQKIGQIFTKVNIISKQEYDDLAQNERLGQDYGSNDPTTLVGVKIHDKNLYIDEKFYLSGLTIDDIDKHNHPFKNQKIVGDSQSKQLIETLNARGFWVVPSKKGPDSVTTGIKKMLNYNIYITETSENVRKEFDAYSWSLDKDGLKTDYPEDKNNHGIDPVRYAIEDINITSDKDIFNKKVQANTNEFKFLTKSIHDWFK